MPTSEGEPSLADSFDLLADETRLRIVRVLLAAEPQALRFSELRDRAGVRDTGRFNYHLGRLRGPFVEKREDGYVLTPVGRRLAVLCEESSPAGAEPGTCGQ